MNKDFVQARLQAADRLLAQPISGDERHTTGRDVTAAAVLVGLVPRPDGIKIILTQRTNHLKDHAGQISFPGGRAEPDDADSTATALREAEEEIGLVPTSVEILGHLPFYRTITGFEVDPVVGWVAPPKGYVPDPFEVAEVFEVPLAFIVDPQNHQRDSRIRNGVRRSFFVLPYEHRYIWGATAGMLVNFARLLSPVSSG